MARFAANTDVSVEKSRRKSSGYHALWATHTAFMSRPGGATIAFEANNRRVIFELPLPDRADRKFAALTTSRPSPQC